MCGRDPNFFTVKRSPPTFLTAKTKSACNSYENSVFGNYQYWKLCACEYMAGHPLPGTLRFS
jgi:hypothetical protein